MFPMVPQPVPLPSPTHHIWNIWTRDCKVKSGKVKRKIEQVNSTCGCIAATPLVKDLKCKLNGPLINPADRSVPYQIVISVKEELQCTDNRIEPNEWMKCIRIANDVHSYNTILEIVSRQSGQLQIRLTKNIEVGQELILWFSEEILALMYIPFLTPANIRGNNSYTCTVCEKTFEYPNPLKFHMATDCEKQQTKHLWSRLESSLSHRPPKPTSPNRSQPPIYLTPYPTGSRLSAFHPVITTTSQSPHGTPSISYHPVLTDPMVGQQTVAMAAAHLETIVSNMGTSKQGHLCIYCGKLYSRKYGLKIHIRTHTGFKPLKCKYCYRPFGDPSNLNKHIRLHRQSNAIYKCTYCDKILVRRRDLQRHIHTRHRTSEPRIRCSEIKMEQARFASGDAIGSSSDDEVK